MKGMKRSLPTDSQEKFDHIQILCQKIYANATKLKKLVAKYEIPQQTREKWIQNRQHETSKVFFDPLHLKILMQLAEEICTTVPLSQFVVMGCFVRAIKEWQIETSQSFLLVAKQPRPIKIRYASEIFSITKKFVSRSVPKFPNKEMFFDDLFIHLLDQYEEYLAIYSLNLDGVSEDLNEWC